LSSEVTPAAQEDPVVPANGSPARAASPANPGAVPAPVEDGETAAEGGGNGSAAAAPGPPPVRRPARHTVDDDDPYPTQPPPGLPLDDDEPADTLVADASTYRRRVRARFTRRLAAA